VTEIGERRDDEAQFDVLAGMSQSTAVKSIF
jgi:hypothetical protein